MAIHGADALAARYEAEHDDYRAIMVKALADRLAEAFAEYIHLQARRDWFEPDAEPDARGPARRAVPRHPAGARLPGQPGPQREAGRCSTCSDAERLGLDLTESFAMTPAASVSGLIFAHPASRYFTVGRIGRDQVEDYAARRGQTLSEVERWLRPNLAYDPLTCKGTLLAPGA